MHRLPVATLVLALLVGASTAARPGDGDHESAEGVSEPVHRESVVEEYRVETEHGSIHGVVERPVVPEGVHVPVILTYTPYRALDQPVAAAESGATHLDRTAAYYVPRGYARAIFDLVGTRESGGCTDFGGIRERETGAAVVDFLGGQAWSNGRVGMVGASYDGTTAISAAIEAPEHLVTIVPQVAIDRWWDYAWDGGVRRYAGSGTPLLFDTGFGMLPPTAGGDPLDSGRAGIDRLRPCDEVENTGRGYGFDPVYDAYFDERDYRVLAHRVTASVLVEAGWLDRNVRPMGGVGFFEALPDDHPKKLVAGQWGHDVPQLDDWDDVRHAWFDHWLLGLDTGVMDLPRVDSEDNLRTRWQLEAWPPPDGWTVHVPLGPVAELGPGSEDAPEGAAGADGGEAGAGDGEAGAPVRFDAGDLTWDSHGSCGVEGDCALLASEPLEDDLRIAGAPTLEVTVSSVAAAGGEGEVSTQVVVQLLELDAADRELAVIGQAMLNSRNRESLRSSTGHPSGTPWSGTLQFDPIDHTLVAGRRLGLRVASHIELVSLSQDDDAPVANTLLVGRSTLRLPLAPPW